MSAATASPTPAPDVGTPAAQGGADAMRTMPRRLLLAAPVYPSGGACRRCGAALRPPGQSRAASCAMALARALVCRGRKPMKVKRPSPASSMSPATDSAVTAASRPRQRHHRAGRRATPPLAGRRGRRCQVLPRQHSNALPAASRGTIFTAASRSLCSVHGYQRPLQAPRARATGRCCGCLRRRWRRPARAIERRRAATGRPRCRWARPPRTACRGVGPARGQARSCQLAG